MKHYIINGNAQDVQEVQNYLENIDKMSENEKFANLPYILIDVLSIEEYPINGFWDTVKNAGKKYLATMGAIQQNVTGKVGAAVANFFVPGSGAAVEQWNTKLAQSLGYTGGNPLATQTSTPAATTPTATTDIKKMDISQINSLISQYTGQAAQTSDPNTLTQYQTIITQLGNQAKLLIAKPNTSIFSGTRDGLPIRKDNGKTLKDYFVERGAVSRSETAFKTVCDEYGVDIITGAQVFNKLFPNTPAIQGMTQTSTELSQTGGQSGISTPVLIGGGLLLLLAMRKK